jgi:hypothetical protein
MVLQRIDHLVITAASRSYGPSLLALLGSLSLNWPDYAPVRAYDIGLDDESLDVLAQNEIEAVRVSPFCPHYRKHFTWKIWCLNASPHKISCGWMLVLWFSSQLTRCGTFFTIKNMSRSPSISSWAGGLWKQLARVVVCLCKFLDRLIL